MKVYIAERVYDHEGFVIIGVFSSEEKAIKQCEKDANDGMGDYHDVEEHEIDEQ